MNKSKFKLPDPNEKGKKQSIDALRKENPFTLLDELANDFNQKYLDRIQSFLITTSNGEMDQSPKTYSFYLMFLRQDKFTYKLFEATTVNNDGKYPIKIHAFSTPIKDYGEVKTQVEFQKVLNKILEDQRTRFIILSNY